MKLFKLILKWLLYIIIVPIAYFCVSLVLSFLTVDRANEKQVLDRTVYLKTNGVHLDIVIHKDDIDSLLILGVRSKNAEKYLAFGWGDENFYLNTPTWGDLTFENAFRALFLKSSTLMHVTRYKQKRKNWVTIKVSEGELKKLNSYILKSFQIDKNDIKVVLEGEGYRSNDDFYKAYGSYSFFKTCNTWANTGFKESGLKSSVWTPFDFGLMDKYQ